MTKEERRDHFAAMAMQGMLSACQGYNGNPNQIDRLTKTAYQYANAMLEARACTPQELLNWRD
jgi:hypothetical protein